LRCSSLVGQRISLFVIMIRKIFGSETLQASEEAAIQRLVDTHSGLLREGNRVSTKSEQAYGACSAFLDALDSAARTMRVDPAPRLYRAQFTINYRALYPDEERNYRVDILEASAEQSDVIYVNGEKFEFSAVVMHSAEALIHNWMEASRMLESWRSGRKSSKSELKETLRLLDQAWANFEHRYIEALILIEEKARRLVVDSIQVEKTLQEMEARDGDSQNTPEQKEERSKLIKCICKLNSVANFKRKGRDDLNADILDDALALIRASENPQADSDVDFSSAKCLAVDVVESYWLMRYYLRDISHCLERVDPHLCNNAGLVTRLVDWEESWEVGCKYVQNTQMLRGVCQLVSYLKTIENLEEGFAKMIEECDVEFIMCLPRLVWLRFLSDPIRHVDLLRSFLPHRFKGESSSPACWDKYVEEIIDLYKSTYDLLVAQVVQEPALDVVQRFLVQRVAAGPNGEDFYKTLEVEFRDLSTSLVEDLMREIEKYSMELQRHCPEEWNQYMALTVQCFAHGQQKQREHQFRV